MRGLRGLRGRFPPGRGKISGIVVMVRGLRGYYSTTFVGIIVHPVIVVMVVGLSAGLAGI